jgi:hypothetical protein
MVGLEGSHNDTSRQDDKRSEVEHDKLKRTAFASMSYYCNQFKGVRWDGSRLDVRGEGAKA